ncbi:MAG: penicillin-binding transpeptidase domain-containing protein [Candidatus Cohnella colombiensis]|uniref:Penicillin-binding transpeptidase domain-containing protein n=1 Tax=Candidatus Cohnella colombiensis TaxID=3121368 RepID=A0AA95J9D8_9BACL|nr:MAG: penicillin-binding transpeptidase domain-containing protein [Cohnella sp.]
MNRKRALRAFHVLIFIATLLAIEGGKIAWLQLALGGARTVGASLVTEAITQRSDGLIIDPGRGQFRDRNGRLLTGETVQSLVAFPIDGAARGSQQSIERVAAILGVKANQFEAWLANLREPAPWKSALSKAAVQLTDTQIQAVNDAGLTGVAVLPYVNRYPSSFTPLHAIGYISQHPERLQLMNDLQRSEEALALNSMIGGAGLERSLDRILRGIGETKVYQTTDAKRQPLEGIGLRVNREDNGYYPVQIITTIDLDVQMSIEKLLQSKSIQKGAVVVLDTTNADVIAMVSLPQFDPYSIGKIGSDERNHAITAAPPGSIFKTVTLAAALESGVTTWDERFICKGEYAKYGLKCWKPGGHGRLSLKEAYAKSCNVVFAELAERMDPAWLQITGDRLGLGREIGWRTDKFIDGKPLQLLGEEEAGKIFTNKKNAQDGGVRAGSGIGQRDVRVTPLQAANMVVSIIHDGHVRAPRIVSEIRYENGSVMKKLAVQDATSTYGHITARTAATIREGMTAVVHEGTAKHALVASVWPLAGKSGTAELAGKLQARNDQWFVGYGPAKGIARYAVAVLIEDQSDGMRNRATELFGDIMKLLRLQGE